MFFLCFFPCNIIKVHYFFIVFSCLFYSCLRPIFSFVSYVYLESINCIHVSLLTLNAVLWTSLLNAFYGSLLILCRNFSNNILLFKNSLQFFFQLIHKSIISLNQFILFSNLFAPWQFLKSLNLISDFKYSLSKFNYTLFYTFCFFILTSIICIIAIHFRS